MAENSNAHEYTASSIKNLSPHDHLLKRISLTFGTENAGSEHSSQKGVAIREIIDNAIDEVRAGYGNNVRLSFFKDGSFEVQDSGRGIPVDVGHDANGRPMSGIQLSLGVIQSGGKFSTDSSRYSSGLNGVGASSTIHTSKRSDITVFRNGKKYSLSFKDGTPGFFDVDADPDSNFTELGDYTYLKEEDDNRSDEEKEKFPTGTIVKCWLNDSVFPSKKKYSHQDLIQRLKLTAFLVPSLNAEVYNELNIVEDFETGEKSPQREHFHFPEGLKALVDYNQVDTPITPVIVIEAKAKYVENAAVYSEDGVQYKDVSRVTPLSFAFRYGDKFETDNIKTFVNTIYTKLGGVHQNALEKAMVKAFNARFETMKGLITKSDKSDRPIAEDFKEGLNAVFAIEVSEPSFTSQSKEQLDGDELEKGIRTTMVDALTQWINDKENADVLNVIANKVVTAMRNRVKARDAKELNRTKNKVATSSMPTRLYDCRKAGTEDAEFYICEGNSALTSMKSARSADLHALLPIRGKIIGAHDAAAKEVLANEEFQDIAKALGAGIGNDFNSDNLRYGRVFLAVDADYDGNHIASLLYALFWHYFRPVITEGRLFKLQLPLYVIATKDKGTQKYYARSEKERDIIVSDLKKKGKKVLITRLKGLGEMNADDLSMHGFDPATRVVTQITAGEAEEVTRSLDLIFSKDKTDARKEWIATFDFDESEL